MELAAVVVCPEGFPEAKNVCPREFALVPDEEHAEEKEEVGGVCGLEVEVKGWVHQLDELVESEQLIPHAGLVAEEVSLHAIHESNEAPESYCVVLLYGVDWC